MHTKTLKKLALALTFWLAVHKVALHAQLIGPDGTSPITFEVDANGLLSATGTFGTGTLSLSGAGTRMFWYPGKAAFRAGGTGSEYGISQQSSNQWDDANIGNYSVAFGLNTTASGPYSTALGIHTMASGYGSTTSGFYTTASGLFSMASGNVTIASGYLSMAFGNSTIASGNSSTAFGASTTASGDYSTALGFGTVAAAYNSFVIGAYNVGGGNPTTWVPTDPLFEIGNAVPPSQANNWATPNPSDALIVYKNGNTFIGGVDNEMPNQTLVNANSILTEGLADARYGSGSGSGSGIAGITIGSAPDPGVPGTVGSGPNIGLNNGSASSYFSLADGVYSVASGPYSVALGAHSTAQGFGSFAEGGQCTASNYYSIAMGNASSATGYFSEAIGLESLANGYVSAAIGKSTASGNYSTAMGFSTATGNYSTATGYSTASSAYSTAMGISTASGGGATAMGYSTASNGGTAMGSSTASGADATAMGYSTASGYISTAMGCQATASGSYSTAMGYRTTAPAYGEVVFGQYNLGTVTNPLPSGSGPDGNKDSNNTWYAADPLLEIGNGTDGAHPSDALLLDKSGNLKVTTVTVTAPGGDIPMFTGN